MANESKSLIERALGGSLDAVGRLSQAALMFIVAIGVLAILYVAVDRITDVLIDAQRRMAAAMETMAANDKRETEILAEAVRLLRELAK